MSDENKKLPSNLSPEVRNRLDRINSYNTPFFNGLTDFNYTLGVPLQTGNFAFLWFDRLPSWFYEDEIMSSFQRFFQANFRSFQGHADVTSQPASYTAGAVGYSVPLPGDVAAPTSDFTTTYLEYTGSPGKAMIERWFNAMHDVNTGVSLLGDMGIDYGDPMNWSADVVYFEVRKDFKNPGIDPIEFASYWRGIFPTNIPTIGEHNYTLGQQGTNVVEGSVMWAGVQDLSPKVRAYALTILREQLLNPTSKFYLKYVDSMGADRDAQNTITEDDIIFKIYGKTK